jgi:hypothetical protein
MRPRGLSGGTTQWEATGQRKGCHLDASMTPKARWGQSCFSGSQFSDQAEQPPCNREHGRGPSPWPPWSQTRMKKSKSTVENNKGVFFCTSDQHYVNVHSIQEESVSGSCVIIIIIIMFSSVLLLPPVDHAFFLFHLFKLDLERKKHPICK